MTEETEMDVDFNRINDDDEEESEAGSGDEKEDEQEVYLPGKPLQENEELVCNESAYVMLHQAHTGAPCLSFDILRDDLGDRRETFPLTGYIVAGTQAARTHVNKYDEWHSSSRRIASLLDLFLYF